MASFDELLALLLEEPPEALGTLADIVGRGRMKVEDLPSESVEVLAKYDLVCFLVTRSPKKPVRTYVYPSPMGLKVFGVLEREAERQEPPKPLKVRTKPKNRRSSRDSGVSV